MQDLASEPVDGGPWGDREKGRVHYEFRGVDEMTGLEWAEPVGPYTELYHIWNQTLYWLGKRSSVITDYILCDTGKLLNPKSYHVCIQRFEFPEMKISVTLTYPRSRVSQWREMKAKAKALLLSFKVKAD